MRYIKKQYKFVACMVACLTSFTAFSQSDRFAISGRAELDSGQMLVIAHTAAGPDTLARSPLTNGRFKLTGNLNEPVEAMIQVAGYEGGFQIMLEPAVQYAADLKKTGNSSITGGRLQAEYQTYLDRVARANAELKIAQGRVDSARQLGHFRTVQELSSELQKIRDVARTDLDGILKRNEDNLLGAYLQTAGLGEVGDVAQLQNVYDNLHRGAKASMAGKILEAKIRALQRIDVGSPAPAFALQTPAGHPITLSDVKGKLKLLDFWASWCGPCRLENPNVVKLYAKFREKGLEVISISLDENKEAWLKAIEKDGMGWLHGSTLDGFEGEVVQAYQVDAVPTIFLLDENNRIIAKNLRGEKLWSFVEGHLGK